MRQATLEHNRTPPERVAGDATFWTGTAEQIAETMIGYRRVGFHTFIVELPAPYDAETMETLITVVKPMVEAATVPTDCHAAYPRSGAPPRAGGLVPYDAATRSGCGVLHTTGPLE